LTPPGVKGSNLWAAHHYFGESPIICIIGCPRYFGAWHCYAYREIWVREQIPGANSNGFFPGWWTWNRPSYIRSISISKNRSRHGLRIHGCSLVPGFSGACELRVVERLFLVSGVLSALFFDGRGAPIVLRLPGSQYRRYLPGYVCCCPGGAGHCRGLVAPLPCPHPSRNPGEANTRTGIIFARLP